ncbi:MAG: MFS transporter [Actinobacteria bacterium]|nr:MFS transporter [Actinomycetota bacterium]
MKVEELSARRVLLAAVVAQTAFSIMEQGVPTLTAFVEEDLDLSAAAAGSMVAVMGVGRLLGFYPAGRAVDIVGERRVLVAGSLVAGVLMAITAGLPFAAMLIVFFAIGLFLSTATPAGSKLVYTMFAVERRELAMGIRQAAVPFGGLVAAIALPLVADHAGWRWALGVSGALTCVGAAVVLRLAGLGPRATFRERAPRPPIRGLLTRDVRLLTAWATVMVGGQYVLVTYFALDVRDRAHVETATAALLLVSVQAGSIAGRIAWGWVADRRPDTRARLLPLTMSGLGVATAVGLAVLPLDGLLVFGVMGVLAGLTINAWQGLWMTRLTDIVGVEKAGTAAGVCLTFLALGWIVFTPALGAIADASSYPVMWGVLAAAIFLGGVGFSRIGTQAGTASG